MMDIAHLRAHRGTGDAAPMSSRPAPQARSQHSPRTRAGTAARLARAQWRRLAEDGAARTLVAQLASAQHGTAGGGGRGFTLTRAADTLAVRAVDVRR
jgi:hypothetical protein